MSITQSSTQTAPGPTTEESQQLPPQATRVESTMLLPTAMLNDRYLFDSENKANNNNIDKTDATATKAQVEPIIAADTMIR